MIDEIGEGISLLVPFRDDHEGRGVIWDWLQRFWTAFLPGAEIVMGTDDGVPFSKTCAINDAFQRCHGDIIVLLDADCYIEPSVILRCAHHIRNLRDEFQEPLWFIPYRRLYRLTPDATVRLIASDPANPVVIPTPPSAVDVGSTKNSAVGHWFGALIQIMPREAFEAVGGMDPRFRGWGSEDVCFVRVLDTMFCGHRSTNNQVFTLWHEVIDRSVPGQNIARVWVGQTGAGQNKKLSIKYVRAYRDPARTRRVIAEWQRDPDATYASHLIGPPIPMEHETMEHH